MCQTDVKIWRRKKIDTVDKKKPQEVKKNADFLTPGYCNIVLEFFLVEINNNNNNLSVEKKWKEDENNAQTRKIATYTYREKQQLC